MGMRILADRDQIGLEGGAQYFFSAETLAAVESFPAAAGRVVRCPRCLRSIRAGSPVVRCTRCGVYHHEEGPDYACYTYAPHCAVCGLSTDLAASSFAWSPAEL
jgi:hypothetical protein